ncbi:hypothetical protein NDU88_005166 [Pleurodeles waltl]|uniref:Uncharacterized protein n=1 Tax=Pleurodeles waltl TaxID=8319 RepID=A0AAV7PI37_PLEWA|nr:hypothetical protein NDU88_005166 [Pleurodeles waltl]
MKLEELHKEDAPRRPVRRIANQGEIKDAYGALEKKLDIPTIKTQALEDTVGVVKVEKNQEEIQLLKCSEQEMQDKL